MKEKNNMSTKFQIGDFITHRFANHHIGIIIGRNSPPFEYDILWLNASLFHLSINHPAQHSGDYIDSNYIKKEK